MDLHGLIDDMKLKLASEKIADGIKEIKALGIEKEQLLEGVRRQVEHEFEEASK